MNKDKQNNLDSFNLSARQKSIQCEQQITSILTDEDTELWKGGEVRKICCDQNLNPELTNLNLKKEEENDLDSQQFNITQSSKLNPFATFQNQIQLNGNHVFQLKSLEYFLDNDQKQQDNQAINQLANVVQGVKPVLLSKSNSNHQNNIQIPEYDLLKIPNLNKLSDDNDYTITEYQQRKQFNTEQSPDFFGNRPPQLHVNTNRHSFRPNDMFDSSLQSSHTNKSNNIQNMIMQFQKNHKEISRHTVEAIDSNAISTYKSNFLKRLYFILKFVKKIKFNVIVRGIEHLSNGFSELVNDKASYIDNSKEKTFMIELKSNILSKLTVFQQESLGIILWDCMQFFTILLQTVWIPMKKSFFLSQLNFDDFLYKLSCFIFLASIVIRFNTSVYFQGNLATDRREIAKSYLRGSFFLDIFTTIVLIISGYIEDQTVLFIIILRIYQLPIIEKKIKTALIMRQQMYTVQYELVKLITVILLVAHFNACGFYYVGTQSAGDKNWIHKNNLTDLDWNVQYLNSLYFSVITMITVGYGDITPISSLEKIYVMVITIIGSGIFAYSINTIGEIIRSKQLKQESFLQIFKNLKRRQQKYFQKRNQQQDVLNYLQRRQVPKKTMLKVVRQLEYISQQEIYSRGEYVLQKLNEPLQQEVKLEFFGKIIKGNKVFSKLFSSQFLNRMALIMKDIQQLVFINLHQSPQSFYIFRLYPNEILNKKGENCKRIYFIYQGFINSVFERDMSESIIQTYKVGSLINLKQFFNQKQIESTLKSVNICTLIYCEYDQFIDLISSFSEDYEKFCKIRDIFQQDIPNELFSNERCHCCKQFSHETIKCSCLSIIKQSEVVIKRFSFPFFQKREKFMRRIQHTSTLRSLKGYRLTVKEFRIFKILQEQKEDIDQIFNYEDVEEMYEWGDQKFLLRTPVIKIEGYEEQFKLSGFEQEDESPRIERNQISLTSVDEQINKGPKNKHNKCEESYIDIFGAKIRKSTHYLSYLESHKTSTKEINTQHEIEKEIDLSPNKRSVDYNESVKVKKQSSIENEMVMKQKGIDNPYSFISPEQKHQQENSFKQQKYQQNQQRPPNILNIPMIKSKQGERSDKNFNEIQVKPATQETNDDGSEVLDVFINNFDKMKEYKIYFPHNNYQQVLISFKKYQQNNKLNKKLRKQDYKSRKQQSKSLLRNKASTFIKNHLTSINS